MTASPFLRAVLVSLTLWIGAALVLDAHGRRARAHGSYDAIVVAGCRVMPDGQPSPALARRTRHAVALWEQGLAPRLVMTGGVGTYPPAEGQAAADLARSLGVPDEALWIEGRSTSTAENARYAALDLAAAGIDVQRILVVSDSYHVFRASRVFAEHFPTVQGVGSTPTPWVRVRGSMREVLALTAYLALGRISLR